MRRAYRVQAVASAPAETVWPLVATAARWTEWSGLRHASLDRAGAPDPEGVGAIRRFGFGPMGSREEVVAWEPHRHLAYTILSGFPVDCYRADVSLAPGPRPDTTTVIWEGTFEPRWPGSGPLVAVTLRAVMGRFVRRLCAHASRLPRPEVS